jgi:hypothetical protein
MLRNIYAIRDNLAEVFNTPFYEHNHKTAIRGFEQSAKDAPNKDDYSLYHLGTFDDNSGQTIPGEPTKIFSGLDIKVNDNDEHISAA